MLPHFNSRPPFFLPLCSGAGIALISGGKRVVKKKKVKKELSMREQALQDLQRELEAFNMVLLATFEAFVWCW